MSALKQVFVRVHFKYDRDRHADELERFARWLLAQGYPNKSARTHLFRLQQVLHAIGLPSGAPLGEDWVVRAFLRIARGRWRACHTQSPYATFLRSEGRLAVAPTVTDAAGAVLLTFCERQARVRGLAPSTIDGYRYWVRDFLGRVAVPGQSLYQLPQTALSDYIQKRCKQIERATLLTAISCIRAFLLDCHQRGHLPRRIDEIQMPRIFRRSLPPRAMPWPLIEQLLRSIDLRGRTGHRDRAMLHLMAHYGLRTGELAHLRLDSTNFEDGTLVVDQAKTHSTLLLPLHKQTVALLRDYLRLGRPQCDLPWLFVRGAAPLAQMTKYSISFMFRTRASRSGLQLSAYSSYSLRHAFAHRLFQRGVGMKAIGDLMGHRSLVSTSIYLRLQTDVLREVALPVPEFHTGGVA